MNEHLIRTPIVDKNGKATTVRRRALTAAKADRILAGVVPTLAPGPAPKVFKPTKRQLEERSYRLTGRASLVHPGLKGDRRRQDANGGVVSFGKASDQQIYGVISAVNNSANAVALLGRYCRSAEQVRTHLGRLGYEELIADRSELTLKAFERGIDAQRFIDFDQSFADKHDPGSPLYLDAAEVYAQPLLRRSSISGLHRLHHAVLEDQIGLKEIRMYGVQTLTRTAQIGRVLGVLKDIHARQDTDFTVEQLSTAIKRCGGDYAQEGLMLRILSEHGGDFAVSIDEPKLAGDISYLCEAENADDFRDALSYVNEFRKRAFRNHAEVYRLYRAGVDLDFAAERSERVDEYTVAQVIALYNGIAGPVTDGWL